MLIEALENSIRRAPSNLLRRAILMPIPGSKRAIRKRGRDFIFEMTTQLSIRTGIPITTGLQINRRLLDQSRLSAGDRIRNISESFNYIGAPIGVEQEIFLVDDLVTTGATLLEAKRALNLRGISVNRAITACMAQTLNIGG